MKQNSVTLCSVLLALLCLVLVVGCPKQPDNKPDATPLPSSGDSGANRNRHATDAAPVLLLLEPALDETSMIPSEGYGKIAAAAETVPFPPIADLIAQAEDYLAKIGKNIEDLEDTANYQRDADHIVRDANGLALVALSIGLCPEESRLKKAAPAVIKAAKALAVVKNHPDAQKSYDALKASFADEGDPSTLSWTKVADLNPAMKAVPNLDSTAKRLSNNETRMNRERNIARITGPLAGLAAIAQGCMPSVKESAKPDAEAEWIRESVLFRNAAIKANAAAHAYAEGKGDYAAYSTAYEELSHTCETCHEIFQPK